MTGHSGIPWRKMVGRWRQYAALPLLGLALGPFGCRSPHGAVGDAPVPLRDGYAETRKGVAAEASAGAVVQASNSAPTHDTHCQEAPPGIKVAAGATVPLPAVPGTVSDYPIDLETALGLAGVENPTIALAWEAVRASQAEQLQARALLLPTLNAGVDVDLHRGNLESGQGIIRTVNRESLAVGAGVAAFGAGTATIPGVRLVSHLADAVYEPHVARQRVAARQFDATATNNSILLDVATRYFDLVGAEERLRALRQSKRDLDEVVRLTTTFAKAGQGRQGDADRAASEAELMNAEEVRGQEEVAVAAAELARLLDMDPACRLHGNGGPVPRMQLVDPAQRLPDLIQIALHNRPELRAAQARIALQRTRLRQQQVRPLLPLMSIGFSADGFGGSSNQSASHLGNLSGRTDFDVVAVWSLENCGLGNLATQHLRRAAVGEAVAEQARLEDRIRREVADSFAQSTAALRVLDVTRQQLQTAEEGFRLDLVRARNNEGRPIEVLNSVSLLRTSRQEYLRALLGYNQAQFRLFVSLGSPPPATTSDGVESK